MSDIQNYANGKILRDTKLALYFVRYVKIPVFGFFVGRALLLGTKKYGPVVLNLKEAAKAVKKARKCAVGERICRPLDKNSPFSESIFFDGLAEALVKAGKAEYVSKKRAVAVLEKYSKEHPIILSKTDGKYFGICTASKEQCIFLKMAKSGLKVFEQRPQ